MKFKFNYSKSEYERHPEAVANKYTIRGMTIAITVMCGMLFFNLLNVFPVDTPTLTRATVISVIIYLLGIVLFERVDLREKWVKYAIIFWVFAITTVITSSLTFHAYLVMLLPILYCSMYSSKHIMYWAYGLTVVNIILTVYVGYYFGICDCNMALLSGKPLADYVDAQGNFLLTDLNDRTWWTLPLFFVVPRSIICGAFAVVCSKISTIIRDNMQYLQEMEELAEIDEMTGVYNRNKYLSMTTDGYDKEDTLAVIFWDINGLKRVNDTMGHDSGDTLIIAIAKAIKNVSNQFDQAYRIGGDEFVMIMRGGNEHSAKKKIKEWEEELAKIGNIDNIPISASYGYGVGSGKELADIIHKADQMMYENKRTFHEKEQE